MIESVTLKDMPIPPSVNKAYATDFRTKRRFKSKDYQLYESMIKHWCQMQATTLASARQYTTYLRPGQALEVQITFYFPRERVLTKGSKRDPSHPKMNDTSNRIKIAHDVLSKILGIDDSYFWDGSFKKQILNQVDFPGFMDVTLTIVEIPGYDGIRNMETDKRL